MNLLFDPWLPLRRQDGSVELAAPWQVTDRAGDDPFVGPASVRADFDGSLIQFLIGLLQTALPPQGPRAWRERFDSPPHPEALRRAFESFASAFELFGEGPRFLQDLTLERDEPSEEPIERLLIDSTLRHWNEHLVEGGGIESLCPSCVAQALFTLQINAPSGGRGHRTGIRGGGPLTTLVIRAGSLWQTVWLNVLETKDLDGEAAGKDGPGDCFPWMAPTRTSGKSDGRPTTLADVHPLQVYWAMPRRIRLRPEEGATDGACSLCGSHSRLLVRTFLSRNLGVNYTGAWNHPLTPYRESEEQPLPLHGSPTGLSYRDWLGLVQNNPDRRIRPATVVRVFQEEQSRQARGEHRLWAFGYDMDRMKARAWLDGRMPLFILAPELREAFELGARRLVNAAAETASALVFAAKRAVTDSPEKMAHDPADVGVRFWQDTEAPFYEHLRDLLALLESGEDDTAAPRRRWLTLLRATANQAFRTVTVVGSFAGTDPRRVALAWNGLQAFFASARMKEALGLPVEKRPGKRQDDRPNGERRV